MPGVPSGRACDACRRSRKKCGEQKPKCSRCVRLGLPCIGSGEKRYRFKALTFTQSPSNETTKLVSATVSKLEVRDVRWDIVWSFGDILREVPQRLGNNHALDAAATAVVETMPMLTQAAYSPQMIRAYAHALRTLHDVLKNSTQAREAETWVAIYLMFICQGWYGFPNDSLLNHSQGLLRVWSALRPHSFRTMELLDKKIVCTLLGPVVIESLLDPSIVLDRTTRTFMADIDASIAGEAIVSDMQYRPETAYRDIVGQLWTLHCILRLPDLVSSSTDHAKEVGTLLSSGINLLACLQHQLSALKPPELSPTDDLRQHAEVCRTLCFTAALILVLAAMATKVQCTYEDYLGQQAEVMRVLLPVVQQAQMHRPLGALSAMWALVFVWASSPAESERRMIAGLIGESAVSCFKLRAWRMMQQADGLFARLLGSQ